MAFNVGPFESVDVLGFFRNFLNDIVVVWLAPKCDWDIG